AWIGGEGRELSSAAGERSPRGARRLAGWQSRHRSSRRMAGLKACPVYTSSLGQGRGTARRAGFVQPGVSTPGERGPRSSQALKGRPIFANRPPLRGWRTLRAPVPAVETAGFSKPARWAVPLSLTQRCLYNGQAESQAFGPVMQPTEAPLQTLSSLALTRHWDPACQKRTTRTARDNTDNKDDPYRARYLVRVLDVPVVLAVLFFLDVCRARAGYSFVPCATNSEKKRE